MASNPVPYSCGPLRVMGGDVFAGLTELGTVLDIKQITAAQFQPILVAFEGADDAFNAARTARKTASNAYQAADGAGQEWLGKARLALVPHLGSRWSEEWAAAGFTNHSTSVPAREVDRLAAVAKLVTYFTGHPAQQSPSTGVTAAAASELHYTLTTTRLARNAAKTSLELKGTTRETKCGELRKKIRLVIDILESMLAPLDGRWSSFGLNMPGAETTPGQPQNVVAESLPNHLILAQCEATPLATRYRWRIRVLGVDERYRLAASTTLPSVEISDVEPGQRVSLVVQAVNGASQGVASEPVEVTVMAAPAPVSASAPVVTEAATREEHAPQAGNGNGHGNGVSRTLVAPEHGALVFAGR